MAVTDPWFLSTLKVLKIMVRVVNQEIPSEMLDRYLTHLTAAYPNPNVPDEDVIQTPGGGKSKVSPSPAQLAVRQAFKDSCVCWWKQKEEGYAIPPEIGPRPLWWWYQQAVLLEMMVFHYYMHRSIGPFYYEEFIPWCEYGDKRDVHFKEAYPTTNYGLETTLELAAIEANYKQRLYIMKDEDEYDINHLNLYCTYVGEGVDYEYPLVGVYSIRRNFFDETLTTWQNQTTWYEMLTYHAVSTTGWHKFYTGTDWVAFGLMLSFGQEEDADHKHHCRFASMQHPNSNLHPYWET